MKVFKCLLLIFALLLPAVRADLAAKILSKYPDAKLSVDGGKDDSDAPKSNLDIDAYKKLSQKYAQPKAENHASAQNKSAKVVLPADRRPTEAKVSESLSDLVANRRLNEKLLNGLPIVQPLMQNAQASSGIPEIDHALFSVDSPEKPRDFDQQVLRQKIAEISSSMSKFKSANLKYVNSIDIELKNEELFKNAKNNITLEIQSFRNRLDVMREKARSVKAEKNQAVLELEELINQRAIKLRQISDLTKKNEDLNSQYALLEKQIGQTEKEDSDAQNQIKSLSDHDAHLKRQFEELKKKYEDLKAQKAKNEAISAENTKSKVTILSELNDLDKKIAGEIPLNDQLKTEALTAEKQMMDMEAQIAKYHQESVLLDQQLRDLDKMKTAALNSIGNYQHESAKIVAFKQQVKSTNDQINRRAQMLNEFEHEIKVKERTCRCSRNQLSKIVSEKQMALNNQQAIAGLMQTVQSVTPGGDNLKVLNTIIQTPLTAPQQQHPVDPSKLSVFTDPYFQQSNYFREH